LGKASIHRHPSWALVGVDWWSAVTFKCKVHDQWIGLPSFHQYKRLHFVANNSRFLILPDARLPNFASPVVIALNLKRLYCAGKPSTVILLSCRHVCRSAVLQCGLLQGPGAECFSGSSADLQDTQAVIIPTTSPKWSLFTLLLRTKKENALNHNPDKYFTKKETQPMHLSTKKTEDLKERLSQIPGTRMA